MTMNSGGEARSRKQILIGNLKGILRTVVAIGLQGTGLNPVRGVEPTSSKI